MSNSSAGVQSDGGPGPGSSADLDAVAPASAVDKLRKGSVEGRSMSNDSGGTAGASAVFARDRACSFYGEGVGQHVGEEADDIGPVTKAVLRDVLNEDYELYTAGVGVKGGPREGEYEQRDSNLDHSGLYISGQENKPDDMLGRAKSAPIKVMAGIKQPQATRKARSFQLFGEEIRIRMDSGSGTEGDEIGMIGREVEMLIASLEKQRLSSVTVPLFVEEVGRVPRAAIVEGRMKKVKVCEEDGVVRSEETKALCGILTCFDGERGRRRRRKKKWGTEREE